MQKVVEFIGRLPTTNLRIVITLLIVIGTATRYWTSGSWSPSIEWLMFLTTMSGLDAVQFSQKRKTQWRPSETEPELPGSEEKG